MSLLSLFPSLPRPRPEDDDFDMEEELRKLKPARLLPRQPELEPRSRRGLVVSAIPEGGGPGDSEEEDEDRREGEETDSDGPILYRDDSEEDDEDEGPPSELSIPVSLPFRNVAIDGRDGSPNQSGEEMS